MGKINKKEVDDVVKDSIAKLKIKNTERKDADPVSPRW